MPPSPHLLAYTHALQQSLAQPPAKARAPFYIGHAQVGSIELPLAQRLVDAGFLKDTQQTVVLNAPEPDHATATLHELALGLHTRGLAGKWRDEQLAVTDAAGVTHATVERAVVRVLGITTFAVHLIGLRADGRIWLQRRSMSKATDPGKLDTLVGGLVTAGETLETALQRETWEEAGIHLECLELQGNKGREPGNEFTVRCPIDAHMGGYMVEKCYWHTVVLPGEVVPCNHDGEVSEFVCLTPEEITPQILSNHVAAEAVIILSHIFSQTLEL